MMTPTQMLAELAGSYSVSVHRQGGAFHVELLTRSPDLAQSPADDIRPWRYIDTSLDHAIARAWAGERPDA